MSKGDDWPEDYQDRFWREYPRRIAKKAAMRALEKVKREGVLWLKLIAAVRLYAQHCAARGEPEYIKHPATWLNGGCWEDELTPPKRRSPTFTDIGWRR